MTEEEKKAAEEAAAAQAAAGQQIVYPLNSTSTTQHGDKVTTKQGGSTQEVSTTQKSIQFTPGMKALYEQDKKDLADLYQVDPVTGRYKGTPGQLLGFDPDEYIKKQQQEEKEAQSRARWKYWGDIANTLIELGTQHGGGTVFARQNNNELSEQEKKVQAARDNIFKMQQSIPQAMRARELQYQEALQKRKEQLYKAAETTTTGKQVIKGDEVTTTTQGNDVTMKQYDQLGAKNGGGNNGGGNNGGGVYFGKGAANKPTIVKIQLKGSNGQPDSTVDLTMPFYVSDSYARLIGGYLKERAVSDPEFKKFLISKNILEIKKDPTGLMGTEQIIGFNFQNIAASGVVFEDPKFVNAITQLIDQYATPEEAAAIKREMYKYQMNPPKTESEQEQETSKIWDLIGKVSRGTSPAVRQVLGTNAEKKNEPTWGDVSGVAEASEEYDD